MKPDEGFPPGTWDRMAAYLRSVPKLVGEKPKAILIISGHWTEPVPTIYSPTESKLLFDYHGFPEHTYQLKYPVATDRGVASETKRLLAAAGFGMAGGGIPENTDRGYDHGVFIPLMVAYPEADVPLVQLSLVEGYDPATHLKMGQALAPLREQGVLIVASGMSYHNLRRFFSPTGNEAAAQFDVWLNDAVTTPDVREREEELLKWRSAPSAVESHPEDEHLLPLLVAAGAAGEDLGRRTYSDIVFGKAQSAFVFGG